MSQQAGNAAATKIHRRCWRINEAAARYGYLMMRNLLAGGLAGDAGHRLEADVGVLAWPTIEEPAVCPGSGGALY